MKTIEEVMESFYAKEVARCIDKIVDLLAQGNKLHTNDVIDLMWGIRFSEDYIAYIHARVNERLRYKGYVLSCYPHIIPPYDPEVVRTSGYDYVAFPIDEIL